MQRRTAALGARLGPGQSRTFHVLSGIKDAHTLFQFHSWDVPLETKQVRLVPRDDQSVPIVQQ
jgi:hypothetical protein